MTSHDTSTPGPRSRLVDLEEWIIEKVNHVNKFVTAADHEALIALRKSVGQSWNVNTLEWVDIDNDGNPVQ